MADKVTKGEGQLRPANASGRCSSVATKLHNAASVARSRSLLLALMPRNFRHVTGARWKSLNWRKHGLMPNSIGHVP